MPDAQAPLANRVQEPLAAPIFRILPELRKDWPFFGILGFALGIIQKVAYDLLDGANVGSDLLQEHIAFNSLLVLTMLIWAIKGICILPFGRPAPWIQKIVDHVEARVLAFGSVAALVTFGFALSALMFGAVHHGAVFLIGAAYFAAVTEAAITPGRKSEMFRRGFIVATTLIWAIPFAFWFVNT
ncbi:hypothetical protein [Achromobacter spanius]|uniref:hypothetical protein n=1 Tax=Achromobacter spanius TaxID=217203 RepID=UPI003802BC67